LALLLGVALAGGPVAAGFGRDRDDEDLRRKHVLGTYAGTRNGPNGRQEVVLTLAAKKEATLETITRGARRTQRGEWEFDRDRDLVTLNLTTGGRQSLSFRADGNRLRGTQWDRTAWGGAAWDLQRRDDAAAADLLGAWTHTRTGASGRQTLVLDLTRGGGATLRQQFEGRAGADIVYQGNWVSRRDGNIDVTLRRGASTEIFTFHLDEDRLDPVSWNRQTWGDIPPRFRRGAPNASGEVQPGTYWARATGGRTLRLELLRFGQARMSVSQPSLRTPAEDVLYTGTWRLVPGDRAEVRLTRGGGGRADFDLRRDDEDLLATTWDRTEWGPQAPRFRAGSGPDGVAGRYAARRSVGGQTLLLNLTLDDRGEASLRVEALGRDNAETYTGTWEETRSGRVVVEVARGGRRHDLALRSEGDRLVGTSWDREEFGSQALEFERTRVLRR